MKLKPAGRNDGHVTDYTMITDHIFVGSNLCKGESCPIHSVEFKELDICVEINLDDERKEIPPDEIEGYFWMPVVDGYAPSLIQLEMGTSVIEQAVQHKKKVYIHCKNGHGRSPTLVAAYLIRYENMSVDEAISLIKGKRPEIHIEERQKKALDEFSRL